MIAFQNLAYLGGAVTGHPDPKARAESLYIDLTSPFSYQELVQGPSQASTTHSISQTIGLASPAFLCGFTFW